jgi:hypothetical protein
MPDAAMDLARYQGADAVVAGFAELSVELLGF